MSILVADVLDRPALTVVVPLAASIRLFVLDQATALETVTVPLDESTSTAPAPSRFCSVVVLKFVVEFAELEIVRLPPADPSIVTSLRKVGYSPDVRYQVFVKSHVEYVDWVCMAAVLYPVMPEVEPLPEAELCPEVVVSQYDFVTVPEANCPIRPPTVLEPVTLPAA